MNSCEPTSERFEVVFKFLSEFCQDVLILMDTSIDRVFSDPHCKYKGHTGGILGAT